jgi:hypothetical protein
LVVTNSVGSVTSSNAFLRVTDQSPRFLATGAVGSGTNAAVQMLFIGNGTENSLSFSLAFDTNVLRDPVFQPATTNTTSSTDNSLADEGLVGVIVELGDGARFESGQQVLGEFHFALTGTNALAGGLMFTNRPAGISATNTFGQALVLEAGVVPSLTLAGPPFLNRQSGLFEHRMTAGNPGALTVSNLLLIASGLANDSLTNLITLFNAQGTVGGAGFTPGVAVDLRGAFAGEPFVRLLEIAPAESRPLTLEYYVSDHQTVPEPEYVMLMDEGFVFRLPRRTERVRIVNVRFANDAFLIEFQTQENARYLVQYADSPADLQSNETVRTAFPEVTGNGQLIQWIDHGPPKTDSLPLEGSRFYRVLEIQ